MRRFEVIVAGAAALMLMGNGIARADDPKVVDESLLKVMELEKTAKAHLTDKATDALKKDCKAALELAGQLADAKLKMRALNVIGLIVDLAPRTASDVRVEAIKTIGNSGEAKLFHWVRQYLNQPNTKVVPDLIMETIDCAGKLKATDAVEPLLRLEEDSDVFSVNVAAIKALSNYGDVPKWRERIVKDLVDDIRKDRPGVSYRIVGTDTVSGGQERQRTSNRFRTGEASRTRYEALAGEVCACCNKLTGQNIASPEDWFDLLDKYKGHLGDLWTDGK